MDLTDIIAANPALSSIGNDKLVPDFSREDLNLREISTHVGICELLAHLLSDVLRYDPITESYYYFNDSWQEQQNSSILYTCLTDIGRQLMSLSDFYDKETEKEIQKIVKESGRRLLNKATRDNIDQMLSTEDFIETTFDQNMNLIGCSNGVFNTKIYKMRSASSSLFISKKMGANYDSTAECPRFDKFMGELFSDKEIREYVQKIFGSCITGRPKKVLPIIYGKADNGKTCFLEIMQDIFGDYSKVLMPDAIFSGSGTTSSNRQTATVGMKGYRLLTISETSDSHIVNASALKKLTGGDTITDRSLYANKTVEFAPTWMICMGTNALPYSKCDPALETRIRYIPMANSFVINPDPNDPHQFPVDVNIKEKILKERDGIFNWLIKGSQMFDEQGLVVPKAIENNNKAVQRDNDLLQMFLDEGIAERFGETTERYLIKPFHAKFLEWYVEYTQSKAWGARTISTQMELKGFAKRTSNSMYFYER